MTGCRENEAAVISKRTEDAVVSSDPIPSEKENISLTIGKKKLKLMKLPSLSYGMGKRENLPENIRELSLTESRKERAIGGQKAME